MNFAMLPTFLLLAMLYNGSFEERAPQFISEEAVAVMEINTPNIFTGIDLIINHFNLQEQFAGANQQLTDMLGISLDNPQSITERFGLDTAVPTYLAVTDFNSRDTSAGIEVGWIMIARTVNADATLSLLGMLNSQIVPEGSETIRLIESSHEYHGIDYKTFTMEQDVESYNYYDDYQYDDSYYYDDYYYEEEYYPEEGTDSSDELNNNEDSSNVTPEETQEMEQQLQQMQQAIIEAALPAQEELEAVEDNSVEQTDDYYEYVEPEYEPITYTTETELYSYAVIGDIIIVGSSAGIRKAVDAALFNESIANVPEYQEIMNHSSDAIVKAYINMYQFFGPAAYEILGDYPYGMELKVDNQGLYWDFIFNAETYASYYSEYLSNLNESDGLLPYLPQGNISFGVINYDLPAVYQMINDWIGDSIWIKNMFMGVVFDVYLYGMVLSSALTGFDEYYYYYEPTNEYTAFDLIMTGLSNITGEICFVMYDFGDYLVSSTQMEYAPTPRLLAYATVASKSTGYELIGKIRENLSLYGLEPDTIEQGNDFFLIIPSGDVNNTELYLGMIGNNIVLVSSPFLLQETYNNFENNNRINVINTLDPVVLNSLNISPFTLDFNLAPSPDRASDFVFAPQAMATRLISHIQMVTIQENGWIVYSIRALFFNEE